MDEGDFVLILMAKIWPASSRGRQKQRTIVYSVRTGYRDRYICCTLTTAPAGGAAAAGLELPDAGQGVVQAKRKAALRFVHSVTHRTTESALARQAQSLQINECVLFQNLTLDAKRNRRFCRVVIWLRIGAS